MVSIIKKVVPLTCNKTSIQMSNIEWSSFDDICHRCNISRPQLISMIINNNPSLSMVSAIRNFTLCFYRHLSPSSRLAHPSTPFRKPNLRMITKVLKEMQ